MKQNARFLGVDDGAFSPDDKRVLVVGALLKGSCELEAVLSTWVEKDGCDATEKIAGMVLKSRKKDQIKAVFLQGSTLAGFNLVDPVLLHKRTGIPIVCVYRKKPDWEKVGIALEKLGKTIEPPELHEYSGGWFQVAGINADSARQLIESLLVRSKIPEPVRYAHVIASGVTTGESTRKV